MPFWSGGIAFIFGLFLVSAPARAYREARMFQLVWNNVGVSTVARFKCKLRAKRYVMLRVRNMFLTLLTLGFFRPFAMVSEYRMKTESVTLHVKGGLDQLVGQLARQQERPGRRRRRRGGAGPGGMTEPIRGRWFDGRSSQARSVLVSLQPGSRGPCLRLHELTSGGRTLELGNAQVGWPEAWSASRAPRTVAVDLREHGSLEIDDVAGWQAALAAAGDRPAARAAHADPLAGIPGGGARRGRRAGRVLPLGHAVGGNPGHAPGPARMGDRVVTARTAGHGSVLAQTQQAARARQAQLRERFDALARQLEPRLQRYSGYAPRLSLSFRSGLGANAFALPGGTIVMTDGLVEAAAQQGLGDDALVGVLAHEIGHVVHRHTTRMLVEQAVLNVGLGLALGDVSSLVSIGGSLLTGLAYRRSHETEADCFAAALMRKAQLPTEPMADLLLGMEQGATRQRRADGGMLGSLLSSHPATALRAQQLKQGRLEGC